MPLTRLQGLFLIHLSESTPQHGALFSYEEPSPRYPHLWRLRMTTLHWRLLSVVSHDHLYSVVHRVITECQVLTVSPISLFEQVIARMYCGIFRTGKFFCVEKIISCTLHISLAHDILCSDFRNECFFSGWETIFYRLFRNKTLLNSHFFMKIKCARVEQCTRNYFFYFESWNSSNLIDAFQRLTSVIPILRIIWK